jgi:hypothetical protein
MTYMISSYFLATGVTSALGNKPTMLLGLGLLATANTAIGPAPWLDLNGLLAGHEALARRVAWGCTVVPMMAAGICESLIWVPAVPLVLQSLQSMMDQVRPPTRGTFVCPLGSPSPVLKSQALHLTNDRATANWG